MHSCSESSCGPKLQMQLLDLERSGKGLVFMFPKGTLALSTLLS